MAGEVVAAVNRLKPSACVIRNAQRGAIRLLGRSLPRQPRIGGCPLQPSLSEGESISETCAVPNRLGAIHTKETFFASLFARLKPRVEGKGAAWAVAHRISKIIWLILHKGVEYEEKGAAPLNERTLLRKLKRLVREFGRQGIDIESLLHQELAATS